MKTKVKKIKKIIIPKKYFFAVRNGIAWLDLTFGRKEWLKRMDMSKFDIKEPGTCVAGNVFETAMGKDGYDVFYDALSNLGVKDYHGTHLGFFVGKEYNPNNKGWQYLQDIWVHAIKRMKKQARIK